MKQNILKVAALSLLTYVSFVYAKNSTTTMAQSAPTEKTVEQVFKNIKVLNGMPQSQLYPTMRFMAASLGFQCGSCHVIKNGFVDASADDKPEKRSARDMIRMVLDINKNFAEGNPSVSCYTCHRGQRTPQGVPVLPLPVPSAGSTSGSRASLTSPDSKRQLPSADDVLNKYLVAIGGKAATDQITNCVVKGTTTTRLVRLSLMRRNR